MVVFFFFQSIVKHLINEIGYEWGALPEGSVIVDVGGSLGVEAHVIARNTSGLKFVIQDLQAVCLGATKVR
jgi:hypothetical protein